MDSHLAEIILKLCETLNKHEVRYLAVGGIAVALHGYFRQSTGPTGALADKPDIDLWYNPTYENYFNLLNALAELGRDVQQYKNEQTPNPKKSFFKYIFEDFTLDLLPEIKAPLDFRNAYLNREVANIDGIEIPFISFEDLIKDKEASSRPKDLTDIEQLKKNK